MRPSAPVTPTYQVRPAETVPPVVDPEPVPAERGSIGHWKIGTGVAWAWANWAKLVVLAWLYRLVCSMYDSRTNIQPCSTVKKPGLAPPPARNPPFAASHFFSPTPIRR